MKTIIRAGLSNQEEQFDKIDIQWIITRQCNFKCSYCEVWNDTTTILELEQNIEIAKKISKIHSNKKRSFVVIGGEPTIYKDYEKLLNILIENKNKQDVICLFSNGSENINNFKQNLINGLYEQIVLLFSYHSKSKYTYSLVDKLKILIDNDIFFKVNLMISPDNFKDISEFYAHFEKYHSDKFMFECVPIAQTKHIFEQDTMYFDFCIKINAKNKVEEFMDVFYDIYDSETKQIHTETYSQSSLKLLPYNYFSFIGYNCFPYYKLTIEPDGSIFAFCDVCNSKRNKKMGNILEMNMEDIENAIIKKRICISKICPACDTSLLYKYRISYNKYIEGLI